MVIFFWWMGCCLEVIVHVIWWDWAMVLCHLFVIVCSLWVYCFPTIFSDICVWWLDPSCFRSLRSWTRTDLCFWTCPRWVWYMSWWCLKFIVLICRFIRNISVSNPSVLCWLHIASANRFWVIQFQLDSLCCCCQSTTSIFCWLLLNFSVIFWRWTLSSQIKIRPCFFYLKI